MRSILKKGRELMTEKKSAILNVFRIVFSNLLTLFVGVLSSFMIPKVLSIDSYGYYKTFSLYISYCGLFHFGITNGVYLFFAGKKFENLDKKKTHSIITFIVILEFILSSILVLVSFLSQLELNTKIVLLLVAFYNFVLQYESIQRNILEATKTFKYVSIVTVFKSLTTIVLLISFFLAARYYTELEKSFYLCCVFMILALCLSSLSYSIKFRRIIFSRGQSLLETKKDIFLFMRIGLPMMICNLTGTLINSIDRQFVSIYFPIESSTSFSEYSFAYSMLAFITAATAAVTTVIYPYMKGKDSKRVIDFYPTFQMVIVVFASISFLSFFVFSWLIPFFLPKYINSLSIFRVMLPNLAIDVCVTVVMHNYFKYFEMEKKFLLINVVILTLTIGLDFLAYYIIIANSAVPNPIWFSFASVVCGVIWYTISQLYLSKKIKIKHFKNDLFLLLSMLSFYFISFGIGSNAKGAITYFAFLIIFLYVFYKEELSSFGTSFFKKTKMTRISAEQN